MNEASRLLFWTNSSYEVEYIGALQDGAFNCDIVLSANDVVEFNFRVLNDIKDQYAIVFGGNDDTAVGWFQCGCKPNSYEFFQQCTYPSTISSEMLENGWMHVTAKYMNQKNAWPSYVLGQYVHSRPELPDWTKREMQIQTLTWKHDDQTLTFVPYVIDGIPCLWCKDRGIAYTNPDGNLYAGKRV